MRIWAVSARRIQSGAVLAVFILLFAVCLRFPHALANGVSRGLSVCSSVIIPTLYPFMILAGLLTDSPLCQRPGRLSRFLSRWLFGLPGCCGPAILLSLCGGYPAGALAIGRLRRQQQISPEEARRMTLFCVNAGPGFIVSTVGAGLMGSARAGWLLFAAHAGTSVVLGVLLGCGHRRTSNRPTPVSAVAARPIATVVRDTCQSLISMCGFVVLAACALSLWEATGIFVLRTNAVAAVLEVSCGCIALAGAGDAAPFVLSLCLGWGGLAVHGQLAAAIGEKGILTPRFFVFRLVHGTVSGLFAMLLFRWIPAALPTLSPGLSARTFSVSAEASFMLLLLSFVAMLCFSPKKTGNSQKDML